MKIITCMLLIFAIAGSSSLFAQEFKFKKKINKQVFEGKNGKLDYDIAFDEVDYTYDGIWAVRIGEHWGFFHKDNGLMVEPKYDEVNRFAGDFAIVKTGDLYGVINKAGEEVVAPDYEQIDHFNEAENLVKKDGMWGQVSDGVFEKGAGNMVFYNPEEKAMLLECVGKEEDCSDKAMLMKIYRNITYPAKARKNGVEGIVVVGIIIEEEGNVSKVELLRGIGAGCDEASMNVIKSNLTGWKAALQDGMPVKSRLVIPVKFRLE